MNNVDLDQYYTDTFSLVRTMVIKIEALAERDNLVLTNAGYAVSTDKTTWRYYMNLNGDYHPTDEVMVINSIDTGEQIVFSKANLLLHIATRREYNKGGYWYNRLVELYPSQPTLINGILSPIPLSETIPAKDYNILRWNESLVLWNEDQLINKLQLFINSDVNDSFNNEYITTDDLFLPLMIEKLSVDLVGAIHAIRLEDCYTRHTHDFFIWSHIDSYGDFSQYKASLTNEQTMWLFRNIQWVQNNPGQQHTFGKLMDNLLTTAGIPLAKYDMVLSTENQLVDLTPTPLYRKLQLNLLDTYGRTASFIDTTAMITKEQPMAPDNLDQTATYYEDALVKGTYSLYSELPTKALESSMADYTNRHINTLMKVVFNEWIYLAGNNIYKGNIITVDPKTGKQTRLPVDDAYHIWTYLIQHSKGTTPLVIEPVCYQNVLKLTPPTLDDIIGIAGSDFVLPYVAFDIQNLWFPVVPFLAASSLMECATEVYSTMWKHTKLYSQFYDLTKRARLQNACGLMYDSGIVTLGTHTDYTSLLNAYEFDFTGYTSAEAVAYAWDIFNRMTGWDTNTVPSTRVKQSDLIDIMSSLASYTIQIIKTIDDGTDQTELINEWFVGDSRWVGKGNTSEGDFTNVMLDTRSNMDGIRSMDALQRIKDNYNPTLKVETSARFKIKPHDIFKPTNLSSSLSDSAIKFPNNDYVRVLLPGELKPILLLDTYYGALDITTVLLPDTAYNVLGPFINIIDSGDYGTLGPFINMIDSGEYGVLGPMVNMLDAGSYGTLGSADILIDNGNYGVLAPPLTL